MSNFLDRFGGGEFVDRGHGKNRLALINRLHGEAALSPLAGLDHGAIIGKSIGRGGKIVGGENALSRRASRAPRSRRCALPARAAWG